jgi:hypothetical protein
MLIEVRQGRKSREFWLVTALVFLILMASNTALLCIGWFHSVDVRAWWPFIVSVGAAIAFSYASLFSATMRAARIHDLRFVVIYNCVLALTLLLHGALYYTLKVDWLAVNIGLVQLTFFQRIIRSDAAVYSIYAAFLIGALVIAAIALIRAPPGKRRNRQEVR